MKKNRYFFGLLVLILFITQLTQCSKEDNANLAKSKASLILSFELGTYKAELNGTSFLIEVPYGTDISSLSAKVELSEKATIKPDPKTVKDWTNPVSFTVTSESGTTSKYTVEVKILPPVLTFEKLTKQYTEGGRLNATEILNNVKGQKGNYTLKDITNVFPDGIVTVNGTAPNLSLEFNGAGVFRALLHLKHNATSDLDVTIENAEFEITKNVAPSDLSWSKQIKVYRSAGEISNEELLAGLDGTKAGYRVKTVTITDAGDTGAVVLGSGTSAKIGRYTRSGTLTLTLVFEHDTKADKTITAAVFEITQELTWRKQSKVYVSGGEISNTELLGGLQGTKEGYRIKSVEITGDSSESGARVSGSGSSAKIINYSKAVTLTLTLVLEHAKKAEKTITGAQFEITKRGAPTNLTWVKQLKRYRSGEEISNSELWLGLEGSKLGYRIKSVQITDDSTSSGARVSGSGTAAKIVGYGKATILTLTLVFEHDRQADKTITGAAFELTSGDVFVPLTWGRQSKAYSPAGEISNADLLGGVRGTKVGYRIKSVQITDDSTNSGARVSGSGTAAKIVRYGKATILTLSLVLEHDAKADKTLNNAAFEIRKMPVPVDLSWRKQNKIYSPAGEISNAALLNGLSGTKTGYRVKTVSISDAGGTGARVSGSGTAAKIVGYTKAGILTLSIVFEHDTKEDKNITGGAFEITSIAAPVDLSWRKQRKAYRSGEISNAELLRGLMGTKAGYRVKSVDITGDSSRSGARVSGSGTSAKIVGYTKITVLTLTLVFEHDVKADKTITGAEFEITKGFAPRGLRWVRQRKAYRPSGEISNADLLRGIGGTGVGYRIKSVQIRDDSSRSGARVSGNGTAAKIVGYSKPTVLTLTLVFEHDAKADKTMRNVQFEITKGTAASDLSWRRQSKVYSIRGEISNAELLSRVGGTKVGYRIKSVQITDDSKSSGASVSGSGTAAKIVGYSKATILTLTLVVEHDLKDDVTLRNAQFEITKLSAETLTWSRQTKPFNSGGEITNANLLAGVTGSGKNGYTIKTVNITNINGTSARVSGSGSSARITSYNQAGTLTLTIVLEHDTKGDVTISNAQFEIIPLGWTKQEKAYSTGGEITNTELLAGVTGSGKNGYTIKTVNITNPDGTGARVSGSGSSARITSYNRAGTLTLTIVLEHRTQDDVTLRNAQFLIYRGDIFTINSGGVVTLKASVDKNSLTTVTIPNMINGITVTSIGDSTFEDFTSLTRVTLPNSVTSIGNNAFKNCTALNSVTLSNSVTSIGDWVFYNCRSLTRITLPNSLKTIGSDAFANCVSLTSIVIPNSVTLIDIATFAYCTSLTSVTLPNSLKVIRNTAFILCTSLTSITIPNSVTRIDMGAFYQCYSLTSVTLSNSLTNIGQLAFYKTALTSVTIPNSVTSVDNAVFESCTALTSVTLSNSLIDISQAMFSNCTALASITIPNSVTRISEQAFANCTSLASITIPNSVTRISEQAFANCTSLASVTLPDNSLKSISKKAFVDCTSLTTITIPRSVTTIGNAPFTGCTNLSRIRVIAINQIPWYKNLTRGNKALVIGY